MIAARTYASRTGPAAGLLAQVLLLAVLATTAGLGVAGGLAGAACALAVAAALAVGLERRTGERLGPASWVTLARATLAVGVAALAVDALAHDPPAALVVALAAVALVLDLVDGAVARRTGTATALGARFDGEVDALLILALCVYVAPAHGAWVLAGGAARYAFAAGEWLAPWMRAPLPRRLWRRVAAATQGVVLTVAAAGVLPHGVTQAVLAAALLLLAASFADSVRWGCGGPGTSRRASPSRRERAAAAPGPPAARCARPAPWCSPCSPSCSPGPPRSRRSSRAASRSARSRGSRSSSWSRRAGRPAARPPAPRARRDGGRVLSVLLLVTILDLGFFTAFDRPFRPVDDSGYLGIGIETLRDGAGRSYADLVVAGAALLGAVLLAIPVLALLRVTRVAADHRPVILRAAAVLGVLWVVLRVAGAPVASSSAASLAVREVHLVRTGLADRAVLARQIAHDRFRATPGDRLLTGLRGKDVLLVFVESYGRVAVQGSSFSPGVDAVAASRHRRSCAPPGFSARSAFLTSPTFGGMSWLAHSTLQSGLWVDGQQRYDELVASDRLTLTAAFGDAGWRTVSDMPGQPPGVAAGLDVLRLRPVLRPPQRRLPRSRRSAPPPMPDQYTLAALQRRELAPRDRAPVMAEIDLVSSHAPWTRIAPPDRRGTRSATARSSTGCPPAGRPRRCRLSATPHGRGAYGQSIEYSLSTLVSFVRRYGDDNTVLVVLGDHQPATTVSGHGAEPRRPDLRHRPRPEGAAADRDLGLAGRPAARPAGPGVADGRVPRPVPHRVRLDPGDGLTVRRDDRAWFDETLRRARVAAYAPGEFVGQESFMTAGEIRALALRSGIARGVAVLDLCCGVAGPGRFVTQELGCDYLGVDASASALAVARSRAGDLPCRFTVGQVPALPAGSFDVVLLLETMLAFEDKGAVLRAVAAALRPGGRFAFTLEAGAPLTAAEREAMPAADTVWPAPLTEVAALLEAAGLVLTWQEDHSAAHRTTAGALADAYAADGAHIAAQLGRRALDDLLAAHRLWIDWLRAGRVRKLALVAQRA